MATTTPCFAADARAALTDVCRAFRLPIEIKQRWLALATYTDGRPAAEIDLPTATDAERFAEWARDVDSVDVIGPFETVVIELGAVAGKVGA